MGLSWAIAAGACLGIALLIPGSLAGHRALPPALWEGSLFAPWSAATALVVVGEEVFLRARLQPLLRSALGPGWAIWLVATAFALAHAPLYGGGAIPLDLGVGLLVGGLREWTGRVAPSVLAHGIADLGWWFLG
jgi:membrane protease YdiL (CAAX protease family)